MPRQSDLRYTFEPLRGDPFEVVSFTLEEGLSQPFKLTLELVSHHPAIDFYRMLDLAALFTLWRGDTPVRYVHGLVSLFQQGDTGFRRTRYTAVVEPTLARFGLRSNWRIFQGQTVPDIIIGMLAEQKLTDVKTYLCFDHQPREYCVQAGETDLDFIARLAAEEGLLYTFEHRADGHTLWLTDRVGGLGTIGTHTDCPVVYQPMSGGDAMEPALNRFHYTEQVRTAVQVQRDYTFTHPRYNQQHTATGDQDLNNKHKDYERYDYPGRYKRDIAGKPFTKTRLAALRNDAKLAHLEGDDERLQPGLAFDLNDHPREDFNDRWRTIAIKHEGKQHTSLQEESFGSGHGTSYELKASAIRWTSDWKAPLRDKPCIDGPQIATGTAYRQTNLPPYPLPKHKTRMTIKSRTHKGEGFNELRFEDELGQEEVFIHAEKDKNVHIKHNNTIFVGNDRSEKVEHDEQVEIGRNRSERVGNDERIAVVQDQHLEIGRDRIQTTGRNHHTHIGGDQVEEIANNRHDKIAADHDIQIGGSSEQSVRNRYRLSAGQRIEQKTPVFDITSSQRIVLKAPGGSITIDHDGITLDGLTIKIKGPVTTEPYGTGNPLGSPQSSPEPPGAFLGRYTLLKNDQRAFAGYQYRITDGATLLTEGLTCPLGGTEWTATDSSRSVQAHKAIMRGDQRIIETWQPYLMALDDQASPVEAKAIFPDGFLDQHSGDLD